MRLLVCGGRNLDEALAYDVLDRFFEKQGWVVWLIINGDATGADKASSRWAFDHNVVSDEYPPDWKRYGKAAGMIRNRKMLTEGHPDAIVALPGGTGTANMVKIGREAGLPVYELECGEHVQSD